MAQGDEGMWRTGSSVSQLCPLVQLHQVPLLNLLVSPLLSQSSSSGGSGGSLPALVALVASHPPGEAPLGGLMTFSVFAAT